MLCLRFRLLASCRYPSRIPATSCWPAPFRPRPLPDLGLAVSSDRNQRRHDRPRRPAGSFSPFPGGSAALGKTCLQPVQSTVSPDIGRQEKISISLSLLFSGCVRRPTALQGSSVAPVVYRLGCRPFKAEERVRFPSGAPVFAVSHARTTAGSSPGSREFPAVPETCRRSEAIWLHPAGTRSCQSVR